MDFFLKYLFGYLKFRLSRFISGRKNYEAWKAKNYSLKTARIKNNKLADEIETACKKNNGFLTYSEYLVIDQFGHNGYHSLCASYGATGAYKHWVKALARLCQEKNYTEIIELGPGDGTLAIELVKASRLLGIDIKWSGVELNKKLQNLIQLKFEKAKLKNHLKQISATLDGQKIKKKCLVLFCYSLDSLPPEIFVNTKSGKSFPTALLGIEVKNGVLREKILNNLELKAKKVSLKNGVYEDAWGNQFDLRSWNLYQGQRAYVPVAMFATLIKYADLIPKDSLFVIVDEFRNPSLPWETNHYCVPKNLFAYARDLSDAQKAYEEAGQNLLYYPIFFETFLKFLNTLGFSSARYDIEQKLAHEIINKPWIPLKRYYTTYAFLAFNGKTEKTPNIFPLYFSQLKIA